MSATFIEKIKAWINYVHSTPLSEHGIREELLAWASIVGVMAVIWLIGELVYRIENKEKGKQNDNTRNDKGRYRANSR